MLNREKNERIKILGLGKVGHMIVKSLYDKGTMCHTSSIVGWKLNSHLYPIDTSLVLSDKEGKDKLRHTIEEAYELYELHKNEIKDILNHGSTGDLHLIITLGIGGSIGGLLSTIIKEYNSIYSTIKECNTHIYVVASTNFFVSEDKKDYYNELINTLKEYNKEGIISKLVLIDTKEYVNPKDTILEGANTLNNNMISSIENIIDEIGVKK